MRDVTREIVDDNKNWLPVGSRVKVRESGQLGTVSHILPDAFGAPWSIHVKLDEEVEGAPPLVLGPHEIERVVELN